MFAFIVRRLLTIPITILLVVFVTFIVLRVTGDPVQIYLDINATPEQTALLRERLHLDEPLIVQFGLFLWDVLRGDFGMSLQFATPALPVVLGRLGATIQLVSVALLFAFVFGVAGGIVAALRKDRLPDFLLSALAVAGQSMPSFWLGILLIQTFALDLKWLPTSGTGSWQHLILPAVTLATFLLPNFILITRTTVLETRSELFLTTARSKGASESSIMFRHLLPNAINPVLSFLGLQMGRLVGGSIITETIFAWPGIGSLMIRSIFQRDVPVVIAAVFIVSIAIVLANLLVDILQSLIDPRMRLD
ncbi:ABC transporter permease [Oceaniovalibus sp. ACAM 378]|uniref:ABC transporter permease n=1 Tax=Oceaniovalibus sp. ACAM 378 TaxID=2599923 RepID=UPI0011D889DA|nr:ABC transporter permease [Oceaniovalibus sp. ACAM 378]TYB84543.1 ABC transporter permease [Oceaniovalibus sp. ACAM 378]